MSEVKSPDFALLSDDAYVRQAQLIPHVIPISSSSLWLRIKQGRFPAPIKLGPKTTCWRVGDIRQYLASQKG